MLDLESILVFYKDLDLFHIENIRSHSWIENITVLGKNYTRRNGPTICEKCKIEFILLLHDRCYDRDGKLLSKLTCNEIIIKKLLE